MGILDLRKLYTGCRDQGRCMKKLVTIEVGAVARGQTHSKEDEGRYSAAAVQSPRGSAITGN
jgi:hypothetical protein